MAANTTAKKTKQPLTSQKPTNAAKVAEGKTSFKKASPKKAASEKKRSSSAQPPPVKTAHKSKTKSPAVKPKTQKNSSKKSSAKKSFSKAQTNSTSQSINKPAEKSAKSNSAAKTKSKAKPAGQSKKSGNTKNRQEKKFPTTNWGTESVISFEATKQKPPPELTSIAGGFVFHNDKLVLANIPGRGWEIIGGRIDVGEAPEETFRRGAKILVGLDVDVIEMIGVVRIEHLGPEPPNCPYPFPVGYGVQFIGIANALKPFRGGGGSLGRSLITPEGFREHYYEWNEYYDAVFRYAYEQYKKLKKKLA